MNAKQRYLDELARDFEAVIAQIKRAIAARDRVTARAYYQRAKQIFDDGVRASGGAWFDMPFSWKDIEAQMGSRR